MDDSSGVRGQKKSSRPRSKLEDTCRDLWLAWRLARKPSLMAHFDDSPDASDKRQQSVESRRVRIERNPNRQSGPSIEERPHDNPVDRTEEPPEVKKVWDPWAEDEPVFGRRERQHALSRHPGTPPCGNLAVQHPTDEGGPAHRKPNALVLLDRPLRVEIELGFLGQWIFGFVERASRTGFETRISGSSLGVRGFVPAGSKVKVLVTPHGEEAFVLSATVLWVDPSPGPDGPTRAQLALVTSDPAVLGRWAETVKKARG